MALYPYPGNLFLLAVLEGRAEIFVPFLAGTSQEELQDETNADYFIRTHDITERMYICSRTTGPLNRNAGFRGLD